MAKELTDEENYGMIEEQVSQMVSDLDDLGMYAEDNMSQEIADQLYNLSYALDSFLANYIVDLEKK